MTVPWQKLLIVFGSASRVAKSERQGHGCSSSWNGARKRIICGGTGGQPGTWPFQFPTRTVKRFTPFQEFQRKMSIELPKAGNNIASAIFPVSFRFGSRSELGNDTC